MKLAFKSMHLDHQPANVQGSIQTEPSQRWKLKLRSCSPRNADLFEGLNQKNYEFATAIQCKRYCIYIHNQNY